MIVPTQTAAITVGFYLRQSTQENIVWISLVRSRTITNVVEIVAACKTVVRTMEDNHLDGLIFITFFRCSTRDVYMPGVIALRFSGLQICRQRMPSKNVVLMFSLTGYRFLCSNRNPVSLMLCQSEHT